MITRREMIMGLTASAFMGGVSIAQPAYVNRQAALAAALLRKDTLAASAARLGILFGAATDAAQLYSDDAYAQVVARECSLIVPENALKPPATRAKPDGFDFGRAQRLATFAASHNLAFRGHTLVWYGSAVPSWVSAALTTPEQARAEMLLEVTQPCTYFRGRVDSWDVVNEVVGPNSQIPLRPSYWLKMIGPDYIALAFTAARQADPSAILVLNENHIECDLPAQEEKRTVLLNLLRNLRRANVPIDALGIESHLGDPRRFPFNPAVFDRFLSNVQELGLKILITELDVLDTNMPADFGVRDAMVAQITGDYLKTVLRHPGVITVNVWGLTDRHTWISGLPPRADDLSVRPDLLDSNLNRKPAYIAARAAFDGATRFR